MAINDIKIVVKVNTKLVLDMLNPSAERGYIMTYTRNLKMGMKRIASLYAETYLKHIQMAGIQSWTGQAEGILEAQIIEPNSVPGERPGLLGISETKDYVVEVPEYMIALDRFKKQPHWVKLSPGRSITRWYRDTFTPKLGADLVDLQLEGLRRRSKSTGRFTKSRYKAIAVKRHPWIDSANEEARQYINGILQGAQNKTEMEVKSG